MRTNTLIHKYHGGPRHQQGMIAMIIAIIVLLATLLASIALMRSADTSNTIAGSLTFRQGVVQEAERAYETAKAGVLGFNGNQSENDNAGIGYSASILPATLRQDIPDALTKQTGGVTLATTSTGNSVRYVIERLCPAAGPADTSTCLVPGQAIQGGTGANQASDTPLALTGVLTAYRLSVRVNGPKNTVGYVQTILR